ncbi:MAG TPA: methyltransferase domain-containing protein [Ignavibacteria bacterium]|nr:methyltransferase domain-containing protein [Ignavibacteria bacterium]
MSDKSDKREYILGINQTELERLEFQTKVWKKFTNEFLDNIPVKKGSNCLDIGSGPGFVSMELRERVGEGGEITALEPSEFYLNYFKEHCKKMKWNNIRFIQGIAEEAEIEKDYYDLIYLRWVIDFVSEPEKLLLKLTGCLKKGGIIAIQDYAYEGIILFPKGGAFDDIAEIVRDYWRYGGGDPYFTVKIPSIFKRIDIELKEFSPHTFAVSTADDKFEWANRFFSVHLQIMADKKIITQKKCDDLIKDWNDHRNNPDTIFFTPIIMNITGMKI